MSYSLRIHPEAQLDAEQIALFIAQHSLDGANRWLDAYEQAQNRIVEYPFAYGIAPDDFAIGRGLRQAIFSTPSGLNYRVVFLVEEQRVTILRVRGPGQELLGTADIPDG